MPGALPHSSACDDALPPSALTGMVAHLDVVYGFALTLTGDVEWAEALTEDVFASVHDDLWSTLGGHGLRDRLLARCVAAYTETDSRGRRGSTTRRPPATSSDGLRALLLTLPWDERAAIALVDQLGLTYAAGAAVLGTEVNAFRARLRRGRAVLFSAHRANAR